MKILQVCSVTTFGGGERHLVDLSRALSDRGHDVYAAVVEGSPLWKELSLLSEARMLALSQRNYVKKLITLVRFLRDHDIEIVHAHAARDYPVVAQAAGFASSKVVLTRHALFPLGGINKYLLKNTSRVIAVSQAVAESLRSNGVIEPSKIRVVHNGIDIDRFMRPLIDDDTRPMLVGTVGHLAPIKGHDVRAPPGRAFRNHRRGQVS
jgi:glycosyltransferase involved in cell wall biosynthesis